MSTINNFKSPSKLISVMINFVLRIIVNFWKTNGDTRSGSLAFTLLLSFVPFTISILSIISWLPISNANILRIEDHLFNNYLPHTGNEIFPQIKMFLKHSYKLSVLGFGSLILTTYLTLLSLEKQLNSVWSRKLKTNIFKSLLTHTLFLISGPIVLGGITILRTYSQIFITQHTLKFLLDNSLPLLLMAILFSLVYKIIPSHKTKFSHAIIAGAVATLFFNIIKLGFLFCCAHLFLNYHIIYGSLVVIPLFLMWIYLCSLNLLFSAEIIYALESPFNFKLHRKMLKFLNNFNFKTYIKNRKLQKSS